MQQALTSVEQSTSGAPGIYARSILLLCMGDGVRARQLASVALPADSVLKYPYLPTLLQGVVAWSEIARGDTAAGLPKLKDAVEKAGYTPAIVNLATSLRFVLGSVQVTRADAREEGLRRLHLVTLMNPALIVPTQLILARASESTGDRASATRAYSDVVRLWNTADPAPRARAASARRALEKLTREPRSF
jgi:hypothetical protein